MAHSVALSFDVSLGGSLRIDILVRTDHLSPGFDPAAKWFMMKCTTMVLLLLRMESSNLSVVVFLHQSVVSLDVD